MSRAAMLLILPVMLACAKKDEPAADTSSVAATEAGLAASAAGNVAGNWSVRVMPEDRDTTLLMYVLNATNTTSGWTMTLPNRPTMDVRVIHMDGDSIVIENGPYASVLQKNVQVTTHSNVHLEGDKLVGRTIAHYAMKGADSVRVLRTEGVRQ